MEIFELVEATPVHVVLKVNADDPLTVAQHPYISGDWAYISVSRGATHVLTVIKKDSTTFNFYWGEHGHTLISESLELLKIKVLEFIANNYIVLDWASEESPDEIHLGFNSNFNKWQITLILGTKWESEFFGSPEMTIDEAKKYVKNFLNIKNYFWEPHTAVTGHKYWNLLTNDIVKLK